MEAFFHRRISTGTHGARWVEHQPDTIEIFDRNRIAQACGYRTWLSLSAMWCKMGIRSVRKSTVVSGKTDSLFYRYQGPGGYHFTRDGCTFLPRCREGTWSPPRGAGTFLNPLSDNAGSPLPPGAGSVTSASLVTELALHILISDGRYGACWTPNNPSRFLVYHSSVLASSMGLASPTELESTLTELSIRGLPCASLSRLELPSGTVLPVSAEYSYMGPSPYIFEAGLLTCLPHGPADQPPLVFYHPAPGPLLPPPPTTTLRSALASLSNPPVPVPATFSDLLAARAALTLQIRESGSASFHDPVVHTGLSGLDDVSPLLPGVGFRARQAARHHQSSSHPPRQQQQQQQHKHMLQDVQSSEDQASSESEQRVEKASAQGASLAHLLQASRALAGPHSQPEPPTVALQTQQPPTTNQTARAAAVKAAVKAAAASTVSHAPTARAAAATAAAPSPPATEPGAVASSLSSSSPSLTSPPPTVSPGDELSSSPTPPVGSLTPPLGSPVAPPRRISAPDSPKTPMSRRSPVPDALLAASVSSDINPLTIRHSHHAQHPSVLPVMPKPKPKRALPNKLPPKRLAYQATPVVVPSSSVSPVSSPASALAVVAPPPRKRQRVDESARVPVARRLLGSPTSSPLLVLATALSPASSSASTPGETLAARPSSLHSMQE